MTTVFERRKNLIEVIVLTALLWICTAAIIYVHHNSVWPWHYPAPFKVSPWDLGLFFWVSEFLMIESWLMWARTRIITWLGVSLIVVNVVFAVVYYIATVFTFYPMFAYTKEIKQGVRWGLAASVTVAVYQLIRSIDPQPFGESPSQKKIAELTARVATLESQLAAVPQPA